MKKILSLILAVTSVFMCIVAVSCGKKEEAPERICTVCGLNTHRTHPVCAVCGLNDHISGTCGEYPPCSICGETTHEIHPVCINCGSFIHVESNCPDPCRYCGENHKVFEHVACEKCNSMFHPTQECMEGVCTICKSEEHTEDGHPTCKYCNNKHQQPDEECPITPRCPFCDSPEHTGDEHEPCNICGMKIHSTENHPVCTNCGKKHKEQDRDCLLLKQKQQKNQKPAPKPAPPKEEEITPKFNCKNCGVNDTHNTDKCPKVPETPEICNICNGTEGDHESYNCPLLCSICYKAAHDESECPENTDNIKDDDSEDAGKELDTSYCTYCECGGGTHEPYCDRPNQ
ncbi:MAG: hypothetical protein E7583_10145 [Ruminococcaceae bacterium]|nr:hypothetical protein [Oscillospiraceae bacterium]